MAIKYLSISTAPIHSDIKKAISSIQGLGVQGVQFDYLNEIKPLNLSDTGRKQLIYQLTERTFKLASVFVPFKKTLYDETYLDARVQVLEEALTFASAARCTRLLFRAGRLPLDQASLEGRRVLEILDHLAAAGNQHGVLPVLIPCLDTAETMRAYVQAIKSGPVGIDFDPAIIVMSNFKPLDFYMNLQQDISHITARDAISNMDGMGQEVSLGTGEAEWSILAAALNEKLQNSWINVTRTQGDQKVQEMVNAISRLRNMIF